MKKKWKCVNVIKNGLWIGIWFISLFAAVAFNSRSSWFLFYFLTVILAVSIVSLSLNFREWAIRMEQDQRINQGDKVALTLRVTLKKSWSLMFNNVKSNLAIEQYQLPLLTKRVTKTTEPHLILSGALPESLTRGDYHELELSVKVSDSFGVFSRERLFLVEPPLQILPEIRNSQAAELSRELQQRQFFIKNELRKDYDVEALRYYREGDQLNQIDWKLSAKKNELIVKELANERETKAILLFWGNEGRHFERLLAIYYSFEQALLHGQKLLEPLIYEQEKGFVKPSREVYAALEPFEDDSQALNEIVTNIPKNQSLIWLVPRLSAEIAEVGGQLNRHRSLLLVTLDQRGRLVYLKPGQWSGGGRL